MTIPAYRLPEGIERGSGFGPTFRNVIQESISGNEQRFAQWTKCRGVGDLSYGLLTSSDPLGDFRAILALYRAHFGSLYPFRFRDWSDYQAVNSVFGTGNGTATAFQLSMTYDPQAILLGTAGTYFYVRNITLLASTPVINALTDRSHSRNATTARRTRSGRRRQAIRRTSSTRPRSPAARGSG